MMVERKENDLPKFTSNVVILVKPQTLKPWICNSSMCNNIQSSSIDISNACNTKKVVNVKCNGSSVYKLTCGDCFKHIRESYISCKLCSLDFHIDCIDSSYIDHDNTSWFCDNCFTRVCNDELPFKDGSFIDFNCKVTKGFKIAHLNIRSLRNKVDHISVLLHQNNIDIFYV